MIKQYEKNGKKFYKFRNIYIGIDPTTGKEIRKSKSGFTSKRDENDKIRMYSFDKIKMYK